MKIYLRQRFQVYNNILVMFNKNGSKDVFSGVPISIPVFDVYDRTLTRYLNLRFIYALEGFSAHDMRPLRGLGIFMFLGSFNIIKFFFFLCS